MDENKSKEGFEEQNRFLRGVESISKALSRSSSKSSSSSPRFRSKSSRKAPLPDPKSSPDSGKNDNLRKEKKSIWDSLKALSLSRNRKFECRFSLQIHLIEGLPSSFNDASICVYWKRKRDVMVTHPAKVILGVAEFEQVLTSTCTILGKSRPQNSAKYEPKHSSLYASMVGAAELDLGKHRVDLTRFLPLTLEELSEEKSSGKWSTSFRLSGAAKGAVMNVSFGYVVVGSHGIIGNQDSPNELGLGQKILPSSLQLDKEQSLSKIDLLRTGSLPSYSLEYSSQNVEEVTDLHEVKPLPKSASSGNIFHESLDLHVVKPLPKSASSGNIFHESLDLHVVKPLPKSASSGNIFHESLDIEEICSPYKPEVYEEKIKLIKPDSRDVENVNPKNHQSNEGKTSPHACGKPEYLVFQVNIDTVKPNSFPSTDSRKEKLEGCESNGLSIVDKAIEYFSSYEHVKLEQSSMKAIANKHRLSNTNTPDTDVVLVSSQDNVKNYTQEKDVVCEFYHQDDLPAQKLPLQEVELTLNSVKDLEVVAQVSGQEDLKEREGYGFFVDDHTFNSTNILDTAAKHDSEDEISDGIEEKTIVHEFSHKEDGLYSKELLLQEIDSALKSPKDLEAVAQDSPMIMEAKTEYKKIKSYSSDDVTDSFLSMLGIEDSTMSLSPKIGLESPRDCLLFDVDKGSDTEADDAHEISIRSKPFNFSNCIESSSFPEDMHAEHLVQLQHTSKEKAQILDDMETEALACELGLNEKAFQPSPPKEYDSFESPIHPLPEEPLLLPRLAEDLGHCLQTSNGGIHPLPEEPLLLPPLAEDLGHCLQTSNGGIHPLPEVKLLLPPLAESLGHCLQTSNGGFLRSMNPSLFKNSKSGGRLVMQISHPVVVPAKMGSRIVEIVQCLALMGIRKLSMMAKKLMPLEDITGKTIQQIAWEAMTKKGKERQCHLQHNLVIQQDTTCVLRVKGTSSSSDGNQTSPEFVAFEALAPLAMDKIEALSMEGLRIQSGMEQTEAPSNITVQSFGDISALHVKGNNSNESLDYDGAVALGLIETEDSTVDGIMSLSLSLDEWMRLDSGEIDDIDNINEHTSKLLAAHHVNSLDLIRRISNSKRKQGKEPERKNGLLGNDFTIALRVQLRDPLRYEPVGKPMLALIQVKREFFSQTLRNLSEVGNTDEEEEDDCETIGKVETEKPSKGERIPQFRITEVRVAGLKTESPYKKQHSRLWGTSSHQKSGSRWLLANGMGKCEKNPFLKSKPVSTCNAPLTPKVKPNDTLWSISYRMYGTGDKRVDLTALNSPIRNPNIIIRNDTI